MLIDAKHPDENNKVTRLVITKIERQELLDWTDDHFPEFKKTPRDDWSDPAKTAHLLFNLLHGRKCADE
jgi:hypothetical protein